MKAVVDLDAKEVKVDQREVTITSDGDFGVRFEGVASLNITGVYFRPDKPFKIRLTQSDGWVVCIDPDVHNEEFLTITRFKQSERSGQPVQGREYLTKEMQWCPQPKGYGPSPNNALRISIPQ